MSYEELKKKIQDIIKLVYNNLGAGYQEIVYQRALENELILEGIKFESERVIPIYYNGLVIGSLRADVVVHHDSHSVIVEVF